MIALEKLVEIGFTMAQATDLSAFFRNVGYLTVGTDCVRTGVVIPANKVLVIDSNDTLNALLKSDSQEYIDISTILVQKGNMNPNKGRVNNVILYMGTLVSGETLGNLIDEFISINANWAQLVINSNVDADILSVAAKVLTNDRLFVAQTSSENIANAVEDNIAIQIKNLNNANVLLSYHTTANENLAAGMAGIMANPNLGALDVRYSTITNITPEDYTVTVNSNLENQNVSFYTSVNAINGGGVSQYASPILYGSKMITGEDTKRRYIRYYLQKMLSVRAIDFLKKRLGYEDTSADVLLAMLKAVLIGGQTNGLIKKDSIIQSGDNTIQTLGWELKTIYPTELRVTDETAYNAKQYKIVGYYRDSLTGEKVIIDLYIDPSDADKSMLGF